MGLFNWLMHRSFRKEARRLAKEVTILYSESKRRLPDAPESEVILRMAFDEEGLASIPQESRKRMETCCSTVNGFCYMMALDGGWGKGMMNFRSLQFTSYMDQELKIAGFPHQSFEQKRKILEEMDLAIDGWERCTGDNLRQIVDKTFLIIHNEPGMAQILQERFEMQWSSGVKTITLCPEQFGKDNCNLVECFEQADLVIITSNHIPYSYASEDIIELLYKINLKMPVIFTPCYPRSGMSINERFPTMNIKWIRRPYDLAKIFEAIYEIEGLCEESSVKN